MAKINLRPWREERAAARQKDFLTHMAATAIAAIFLVIMVGYYYDVQVDRQNIRNTYLKNQISELDVKLKEIEELKRQRERLLERLNAIQELQGNRPIIVRNFDELVRVLPDGLHYTLLERKEEGFDPNKQVDARSDSIKIHGLALQNKDVSELMRNMNKSIWFGEPTLSKVSDFDEKTKAGAKAEEKTFKTTTAPGVKEFDLAVVLTKPKAEDAK
jgi:type IV pilus assembly protein PilN